MLLFKTNLNNVEEMLSLLMTQSPEGPRTSFSSVRQCMAQRKTRFCNHRGAGGEWAGVPLSKAAEALPTALAPGLCVFAAGVYSDGLKAEVKFHSFQLNR